MALNFLNNGYFAAKVGIGTESPGAKLEIKDGNLWLNGATSNYNPEIFFIDDAGPTGIAGAKIRYENNNGNLYFDHKWDTATSGFFFRNRVDGTALNTMSLVNGKVGIDIDTPQAPLSFANVTGNKIDFYYNTTTNDRYGIQVQASELRIHSGAAGDSTGGITFGKDNGTTFTEAMRIRNDGKVGIGTDTPGTILDVSYGVSASQTAQINLNGANGAAAELVMRAGGDDNGTIYNRRAAIRYYSNEISTTTAQWVNGVSMSQTTGDDKFYFNNSGNSTVLCLQQNGNVGIGTTNPLSQLSIGSNAITTKKPTVIIADGVAGGSLVIRGLSPILSFDRTGASPENKILMDGVGLEFKTGTLDAEGDVDFKIKLDGKLQAPAYTQGFLQSDANGNIEISGGGTLPGGPYLPLAGGTMTGTAGVLMPDNFRLKIGTSEDLLIFHDGTNSFIETSTSSTGDLYIKAQGTGNELVLQATDDILIRPQGGENGIKVHGNDSVELYFNNVRKLRTTSGGVFVEGEIKIDSALLDNQENTDVDTGTEAIASVVLATYTAAFFDFVIKKGTNVRSGTVYACHDGTSVAFTETSTQDLGDTSDVTLNVVISTIYLQLQATTTSDDWSVKSLIRAI